MKRLGMIGLLLWSVAGLARADEAAQIRLRDPSASVFGGRPAVWRLNVDGPAAFEGTVAWNLAVSGGVIARREARVAVRPGEPAPVDIDVDLPDVKEGVIVEGRLQMALRDERGEVLAELEHPFFVFGANPAAGRLEWLRGLEMSVYDPEDRTAERLEELGWPFRRISNLSALETLGTHVLLVGEGISLRSARGLMEAVVRAAERGGRVVMLAPEDGSFPPPGSGDDAAAPESLQFHDSTYVQGLDKRLDASPRRAVFRLGGQRTGPVVSVESAGGWAFMEARWPGGGVLLLCGCEALETWEASPAPRYLLMRMLEKATLEKEKEP